VTSYEAIYNRALQRITDPTLAMLPEEDMENMLHGWLMSAIAKMRQCENDLSDRDEELKQFNVNLIDIEQEILAILMTREWLTPQLNSTVLTAQVFSGKEEKYYSQSAHIAELRAMDESLKLEAQALSRDWTYTNNDYFD
jgi:hypothetical protein